MSAGSLALAGFMAATAGLTYAWVGRRLLARSTKVEGASALGGFALWWGFLGLNLLLVSSTYLLAAAGRLTFEIQLAAEVAQRVLLAFGMMGLIHYLVYLTTGRDRSVAIVAAYSVYLVLVLTDFLLRRPEEVLVTEWRTAMVFAGGEATWMRPVSALFLLVPPVAGAGGYLFLAFRVKDREKRWRMAAVAWCVLGWWVLAVVAGTPALLDHGPLQMAHRVLSLLTALAILAAHEAPRRFRSPAPTPA